MVQPKPSRIIYSNSKNSKIMLGIGGIALVIIIGLVVFFGGIDGITTTPTSVTSPPNPVSDTLSIQTDLSSYDKKDIISISGISNISGTINLSIENQSNELVWAEQISLKTDGKYSTLAIAGGQGWENSGTYTIKVDNGVETSSNTFSFTA